METGIAQHGVTIGSGLGLYYVVVLALASGWIFRAKYSDGHVRLDGNDSFGGAELEHRTTED